VQKSSTFCKLQKIVIDWPSLSKPGRVRDNCLQFGQGGEKPRCDRVRPPGITLRFLHDFP
jgi:hypothetical protein